MRITRSTSATAASISANVCSLDGLVSASSSRRERSSASGVPQIVCDRVGNIAYAMNQPLDLVEHAVDGLR